MTWETLTNINFLDLVSQLQTKLKEGIYDKIIEIWPYLIGAVIVFILWIILSIFVYKFIIYLFKRFKILELIDKLDIDFDDDEEDKVEAEKNKDNKEYKRPTLSQKLWKKIQIDKMIAKAIGYYIVLVFFRISIVIIGIEDVEIALWELIGYLPKLFLWVIIWFFWIRFSNFVYDIVYHPMSLAKQKTGKIIASGAKIIILFFTLMLVLEYTHIVEPGIIRIILIGFISMLTIAWGLAFGLGWKDIAKEILESFRK